MLLALLPLLASVPAQGWQITPLVEEGDSVPGVGLVTRIDNIAVNDVNDWLVEADTDNPDTDVDSVLLDASGIVLREGQALPLPVGATLDTFDEINRTTGGLSARNYFLDGTAGSTDDSGVYWGETTLVLQEGSTGPVVGLSAGTPWRGFFGTQITELGQIVVLGTVDDPAIATTVDQAFVALVVDGSGTLTSAVKLFAEGDVLPGQTDPIATFGTGPQSWDLGESGSLLFFADLNGPTASDTVIYLNGLLLAQEGSPSPVAGRSWASLATPELSLNASDQYVFSGSLDGDTASNLVIVKDGAVFRQEGDTLPGLGGFTLTSFGSGPLDLTDDGDVLWYGDWNDPDTDVDTGLFLNDELIVQEGVTTIGGVVVDTLRGVQDGYFISDDGRFIVFEAVLLDGTEGAYVATRSGVVTHTGCVGNAGVLSLEGSTPGVGDTLNFQLDNGQTNPALTSVWFSTVPSASFPCGLVLPGIGEVLIDISAPNPFLVLNGPAWTGSPTSILGTVPNEVKLVGATLWTQGLLVDPFLGAETFRPTNMLEVVLGL